MSIRRTLASLVLGAAALAAPLQAQQPTVKTESSIVDNRNAFERVRVNVPTPAGTITATRDAYPGASSKDMMSLTYGTDLKGPWNLGAGLYRPGALDADSPVYLDLLATRAIGRATLLFDAGFTPIGTVKSAANDLEWGMVKVNAPLVHAGIATLGQDLSGNEPKKILGDLAIGNDKAYVGAGFNGYAIDNGLTDVVIGGRSGNDVGNLTFGTYDSHSRAWQFKTQFAAGAINNAIYNRGLYDFALDYFALPPFHATKFSPSVSKGNWTLAVTGNGTPAKSYIEAIAGHAFNGFQTGIGISRETGAHERYGVPTLTHVNHDVFGVNVDLEAAVNLTTGQRSAYIKASKAFGGKK